MKNLELNDYVLATFHDGPMDGKLMRLRDLVPYYFVLIAPKMIDIKEYDLSKPVEIRRGKYKMISYSTGPLTHKIIADYAYEGIELEGIGLCKN